MTSWTNRPPSEGRRSSYHSAAALSGLSFREPRDEHYRRLRSRSRAARVTVEFGRRFAEVLVVTRRSSRTAVLP